MGAITILVAVMTLAGVAVVLLATGFSLGTSGKPEGGVLRRGLGAWTQTLCPASDELVEVELGVEERIGEPPTLGIFRCSYYGTEAPDCDQKCLDWRTTGEPGSTARNRLMQIG